MSNILKNTSIIAGATFLSRILGFIRDVVVAYTLGTGPFADAFFVAFRIPNLMRRLFAEGSLTMAFVPVFKNLDLKQGRQSAFLFARSAFLWLILILCALSIVAIFLAPKIALLIAPGFKRQPQLFDFTIKLIRICFPYIIFISSVALFMGILNSLGHFLSPAIAPCILNIMLITSAFVGKFYNINIALALSYGVLFAGMGQFVLQLPFLKKYGFSIFGKIDLKHKGVKLLLKLIIPSIYGAAVYQLNILLNTVLASFLESGSVSYLYYADRLVQFPLGIFGVAVSVAALPDLSELSSKKDMKGFKKVLNKSIYFILFISLPATFGLIGMSQPIVEALFKRGAFDLSSVEATSLCLIGYSIGLPAFSLVRTMVSSFYSLKDTKTPAYVATICLFVNLFFGILLMKKLSYLGLALAVSISSWTNVVLLYIALNKKIGTWFQWKRKLCWFMLLSLLILIVGELTTASLYSLILIPILALVYIYLCNLLKIEEASAIISLLKKTK